MACSNSISASSKRLLKDTANPRATCASASSGSSSNARLLADGLSLFGVKRYRDAEHRVRWVRLSCVILPVAFTTVFLLARNPVGLVFIGAIAQGLMLPFLAGAAICFHFRNPYPALRARPLSLAGLFTATAAMVALGLYQVSAAFR